MKIKKNVYIIFHTYKKHGETRFRIDGASLDIKKAEHEYEGLMENNRTGEYTLQAVELS